MCDVFWKSVRNEIPRGLPPFFLFFPLFFSHGNDSHQIRTLTRQLGERRWVGMSSFIPLLALAPSLFCSFYPWFCVGEPHSFETPLHFRECPRNPFLCLFILPLFLPSFPSYIFLPPFFFSSFLSFSLNLFLPSFYPFIHLFYLSFFFFSFLISSLLCSPSFYLSSVP